MSDVPYDGYAELLERVEDARRVWARTYLAENAFRFVVFFGGTLFTFALLASVGPLPAVARWAMLLVLAAVLLGGTVRFLFRPLFRTWSDEEVAVRVERAFPEVENAVINSLQLARDPTVREHGFVRRLIRRAERDTRGIRFPDAIDRRGLARFGVAAGAVLVALAVFAFFFSDAFARSMRRILMPAAYVPAVGKARDPHVHPGDATVVSGDPLPVTVTYVGPGDVEGALVYRARGADEVRREMKPVGRGKLLFTFPEVRTPLTYRVDVGGTESEWYRVRVTQRPAVVRIDVACTYPKYTGLRPLRENDTNGDIKAPAGTRARLFLTASKAVATGSIEGYGQPPIRLRVDAENPRRLVGDLVVTKSGSYTIELRDTEGHRNRAPAIHRVIALPDRRPSVRITVPGKDVTVRPGDKVAIAFHAVDDYGIAVAELLARRERAKEPLAPVARWTTFTDPRNVQTTHTLWLDPKRYQPGDVIEYRVSVTDNRILDDSPAGQTVRTPPYRITVRDRKKAAEEKVRRLKNWEERLRKVLKEELAIRQTATAMAEMEDARHLAAARAAVQSQADQRLEVLRIAGDMKPAEDRHLLRVREYLYRLAAKEMADAVRAGEAIPRAADRKRAALAFGRAVDKVIDALKRILDVLPRLEERAKKEADEDEAFDLSEEAKEALRELDRGLKDFIEEQKKVIDATQELVQKNVDDWTKEDDKKLRDLAATEDKWSQFLLEKHHDLSKLPEQDLANSTLLKELLEVQSEVQMARDALAKKAKEIATAIEDNGLELAKSLETHIEKWLPDTPDRDQWKMEEPLGETEAPMAELPKELEDLVGELMEEEEDLMQDVEDATAGYADSLDKGAGWDAMDGPISNISAQGVTGNRLPNQSEIGGRSGEGRSGKSAGEFVEQDATGKGGRKTPTRLTPDAYEKGQVNDTSKDPVGGSTGGGKASGAGAGGLEGPVPPQVQAKLKALAKRQAELRNKAEKINARFKILRWPTPFEETVRQMKQTEEDLRNARYRSVLRRRPILLKNLKGTRAFLRDQVRIHRDYSSALPSHLQDEILDAAGGGTPRGYERLLEAYYKSISKQEP